MYGVNGEALQLHAVYEDIILYYKSRENLYQLLQVMRAASERAMKVEGLYDKIIITMHSTKLYWKKSLVCCHWHCYYTHAVYS